MLYAQDAAMLQFSCRWAIFLTRVVTCHMSSVICSLQFLLIDGEAPTFKITPH